MGRALATAFTAVFVAAGWLVGAVWYKAGLRHCALSARYGFRTASPPPPGEAEAPPRSRPGPGGTLIEN